MWRKKNKKKRNRQTHTQTAPIIYKSSWSSLTPYSSWSPSSLSSWSSKGWLWASPWWDKRWRTWSKTWSWFRRKGAGGWFDIFLKEQLCDGYMVLEVDHISKKKTQLCASIHVMITWTLQVNEALLEAHRKVVESRLQLEVCMLLIFRQYSCLIKFKSWLMLQSSEKLNSK